MAKKVSVINVGDENSLPGLYLPNSEHSPTTDTKVCTSESERKSEQSLKIKQKHSKKITQVCFTSSIGNKFVNHNRLTVEAPHLGPNNKGVNMTRFQNNKLTSQKTVTVDHHNMQPETGRRNWNESQPENRKGREMPLPYNRKGKEISQHSVKTLDFNTLHKVSDFGINSSGTDKQDKEMLLNNREPMLKNSQLKNSSYGNTVHIKQQLNQNIISSVDNNVLNTYQESGDILCNFSHPNSNPQKSYTTNHNSCLLGTDLHHIIKCDPSNDTNSSQELNISCVKTSTSPQFEESVTNYMMSYIKSIVENQGLKPLTNCSVDPEFSLSDSNCNLKSDTDIKEMTLMIGKNKICKSMLNRYVVFSNLPFGISDIEILYHLKKIGPVAYFFSEGNMAHVIFFKSKHAEKAFSSRHTLLDQELFMFRPRQRSCTLYLNGLASNTLNEEVIQAISTYGVILDFHRPKHRLTGAPQGYCFVKVDRQVAKNILSQKNLYINDRKITFEIASQSDIKFLSHTYCVDQSESTHQPVTVSSSSDGYKGILSNLPEMATYELIREHFEQFGRLKKVYIRNRKGFVIYASQESLECALSSSHTILGTNVKLFKNLMDKNH